MKDIIGIGLGGAIGAIARYYASNIITRCYSDTFPYGTFFINIIGCFFMGILMTIIVDKGLLSTSWRLFLCVGILGGFTTFSSFSYESLNLLQEGNLLYFFMYIFGSVGLGVTAALIGVTLAEIVLG